jgi:hypothetical protein
MMMAMVEVTATTAVVMMVPTPKTSPETVTIPMAGRPAMALARKMTATTMKEMGRLISMRTTRAAPRNARMEKGGSGWRRAWMCRI